VQKLLANRMVERNDHHVMPLEDILNPRAESLPLEDEAGMEKIQAHG
jgi:hypothetical protein